MAKFATKQKAAVPCQDSIAPVEMIMLPSTMLSITGKIVSTEQRASYSPQTQKTKENAIDTATSIAQRERDWRSHSTSARIASAAGIR